MMLRILYVLLVVTVLSNECIASSLIEPKLNRQRRWLVGFAQFISYYTGRNSWDYNNYGCWCGSGNKGTQVVDGIDACCRTHDSCYQNIAYISINWECKNAPGSAAYQACMCDKTTAQCFARNQYNSYWKGKCPQ